MLVTGRDGDADAVDVCDASGPGFVDHSEQWCCGGSACITTFSRRLLGALEMLFLFINTRSRFAAQYRCERSLRGRWSLATIAGLLLCSLAGCGPHEPKTYPVTGKVVFQGADIKELQSWTVQFRSVADPNAQSVAEIKADGRFEAMTVVNNMGKKGVLEGEYKVCVIDVLNPDANAINRKFMGFDTSGITVTVPLEKELIIEVSK